ncbi:uncharacterized protein SOCEGT47_028210 [Sorangium cellulosum]|uniref:Secreted protein n=1 Tax=Sorangium cellulosum TaxID=56 RepID=A0A4P2PZN1_SORCE|nr:hypothetical protein [Sorangium cellulosum]AUX22320.1 uncharacterized protein SOCEGT47_028210 [Sorangium cellulosum]
MSAFLVGRGAHLAIWAGLGATGALAAPAACLYPDYTFDEPEPSASSGRGASGASTGGGGAGGEIGPGDGGSAGATEPEDCSNGVDDDDDNLVDCADPACGAFVCASAVPDGWIGYFALFDGDPAEDPGCPADFPSEQPFLGNRDPSAPPARCTCSCGPAEGQTCKELETVVITTGDAPCGSESYCVGTLETPGWKLDACTGPDGIYGGNRTCGPGGDCTEDTGVPCTVSVMASPLEATGGACAPNAVDVQRPSFRWTRLGRACAAAEPLGRGCNLGQVCAPRPPAPFESGLCIAKDGDSACPPGAYTEKHVFFTDHEDSRGCRDDCTCSAPSGGTCPTMITLYSDSPMHTCATPVATVPAGGCRDVAGNPAVVGRKATAPGPPSGGACAPSGGTPSGEVRGTRPRTFCCRG